MVMDRVNKNTAPGQLGTVTLNPRDRRPLYQQLAEGIGVQIRNGVLPLGARLPALRDVARRHEVALVTASQAYEALASEGFIVSRTGRGTFATYDGTIATGKPGGERAASTDGRTPPLRAVDAIISPSGPRNRRVAAIQLSVWAV